MTKPETLIGTWRLIAMETRFDDGTVTEPYGANGDGRLHYGADGHVAAHLWDPDRHGAAAAGADPAYFSYTGRWSLHGGEMLHVVDAATDPNWRGETLRRDVEWEDEDLCLTAAVEFGGKHGQAKLRWRKLPAQ